MEGDIALDGKSYRIDLATYRVKDILDFAPRASVPGGSVIMSDLGMYQPLVQSDFRRGFGFHWYADPSGYMNTIGDIDTRQEGILMRYTQKTASDTDNNVKNGFTNFAGSLWSWGNGGLRRYSGGSWTSFYAGGTVNFAFNGGDYLFYCPDGGRIKKIDSSLVETDAGVNADATDYSWMIMHNGFIYAGKDGTNRVHYSAETDLSDLEGTEDDTSVLYIGVGNTPTLGAVTYAGNLYITRRDGLYHLGEDAIARKVVDYANEAGTYNFRSQATVNGFLVFPIRDRIVQWNSVRVNDITPDKISDGFPYTTYGTFDNFIAVDNFLYMTAHTNEDPYKVALICYDGAGYHKLMDLCTGTDDITALGYDTDNNRLWFHLDSTADATYYIQMQSNSVFPYSNFKTTGQHSLITSRMDMGFRRVQKSMTSIIIEAENLSSARYIDVYYQLESEGTWLSWGRIDTSGTTILDTPGGYPTREFYVAQLRFDLVTDSTDQSPILNAYTLRFLMRPDVQFGWNFNILSASEMRTDTQADDERQSSDMVKEIRKLRNSKAPIVFVDVLGDSYLGYVTAISETPVYRQESEEDETPDIEYRLNINFISMGE